jgi:uncharacterized protein
MVAPVVHFEIMGRAGSGAALREFYSRLFDWKIDADNPMKYGLVEKHGSGIGGGVGEMPEGEPGRATVYIAVPDTDEYLKKAEALGGKVSVPTTVIPGTVTFAMFTDPQGNLIGLVNDKMP